jgi:hypothetical protein
MRFSQQKRRELVASHPDKSSEVSFTQNSEEAWDIRRSKFTKRNE